MQCQGITVRVIYIPALLFTPTFNNRKSNLCVPRFWGHSVELLCLYQGFEARIRVKRNKVRFQQIIESIPTPAYRYHLDL